jgi:hypothetical protein
MRLNRKFSQNFWSQLEYPVNQKITDELVLSVLLVRVQGVDAHLSQKFKQSFCQKI